MSKGLEALTNMYVLLKIHNLENDSDFIAIEKELKALEIIKIKKVNVFSLYTSFRTQELWGYNNGTLVRENKLKQEEYDLLKEVLSND